MVLWHNPGFADGPPSCKQSYMVYEIPQISRIFLINDETQELLSNIPINNNLGQPKAMFNQHQGADGVRMETCMSDGGDVMATRENAFNYNC
jgi:hypothetical protein